MGIGLVGQVVAGIVIAFLIFRYFKKGDVVQKKLASWKERGLTVMCPGTSTVVTIGDKPTPCGNDMLALGTYKGAAGALGRKGEKFECSKCGLETTFDMDRTPPLAVARGRVRRVKPRRQRRK